MKKRIITLALCILLIAAIIGISKSYQESTQLVLGYGTVEAHEVHVGSRIGGRVAAVHFEEGDMVPADAVLITLDDRELQAQAREAKAVLESAKAKYNELKAGYRAESIEKAQAVVREQEQNLKKLQAGPRKEEIEAQEARVNTAQAEYDHAERSYRRIVENLQQGTVADQQRDDAKRGLEMAKQKLQTEVKNYELLKAGYRVEDVAIAVARLHQAQAELKQLQAGSRKEELDRALAFIQECEARVNRIEIQLEECRIRVPPAEVPPEERAIRMPTQVRLETCNLKPGDILAAGQIAATLLKPDDLWVKIYVSGRELDRIQIGQKVVAMAEFSKAKDFRSWFLKQLFSLWEKPQTYRKFQGKIVYIASQAEFTPRNVQTKEEQGSQVFGTKVNIMDPQNFLRPGMSITIEEIPIAKEAKE